jgi:mannose-6-phosphate isomerase class I
MTRRYDPRPSYPASGGTVERGLPPVPRGVLAVDGPAALPWDALLASLPGRTVVDVRGSYLPASEIERRTGGPTADPVFRPVWDGELAELLDALPEVDGDAVVFGPGAALVPHDELWYVDVPKRHALAAVQRGDAGNVGDPAGSLGTVQRLLFVDWPLLDRHKQSLLPGIDRYVDFGSVGAPLWFEGDGLRCTLTDLAQRPFRTLPTFLPGPWGGQWLRRELGIETDAPNLAWSYELIAPEASILVDGLEVGFEFLLASAGEAILGSDVAARFEGSFPIRFDYLDTLDGGDLSIQCHPSTEYMRTTFGLPYTQDESYYVMRTSAGAKVFLGLREDADLEAFERDAEAALDGRAFSPDRHLQLHDAEQHRLYLIPAGTPHASGAGNVVLEISASPYLYTLRFYDWLRRDLEGVLRPVHLEHAFRNLDSRRAGDSVGRELIQQPVVARTEEGAVELELGGLPELFYAVHRLDFDDVIDDDTEGRFHVLNLVEGDEIRIEPVGSPSHPLAYAETIVIPASVGPYRLRRVSGPPAKVVKAFVKPDPRR